MGTVHLKLNLYRSFFIIIINVVKVQNNKVKNLSPGSCLMVEGLKIFRCLSISLKLQAELLFPEKVKPLSF